MTATSTFVARELDAIAEALNSTDRTSPQQLLGALRAIQGEEQQQRGKALAQRIADGRCAVLGETCLTHNAPYNLGHAIAIDPTTSTD